jgi:mannose-6-phosphate isomerase-like protein (cupin superfamily)
MRTDKPWGYFEELYRTEGIVLKKLVVSPGQSLSLQYHKMRDEFWVIESGEALLQIEDNFFNLIAGNTARIEKFNKHRVTNNLQSDLVIIETQYGKCYEEDIVRIADVYGRT